MFSPTDQHVSLFLLSFRESKVIIFSWDILYYPFSSQIRTLWFDSAKKLELDNLLLVVAQTGVFIYSSFCIIGAFFQLRDHLTAFLSSLMTLVQTTIQTIFILDASSRWVMPQKNAKPLANPGPLTRVFFRSGL